MEEIFKEFTFYLTTVIEAFAAIIIGLGSIEAFIRTMRFYFFQRNEVEVKKDDIRIKLGRWLAIALEFELAADILGTAIAPSWQEIGQLAAIIILRTALNYFLQKEIEQLAENMKKELK